MRIRIKSTPPGPAPEKAREVWVGLELETMGREDLTDKDVLIGLQDKKVLGAYKVTGQEAFSVLRKHNPNGYAWWMEYYPKLATRVVRFSAEACEEIPE